ncbi:MAG: hypothetical protein R3B13_34690 [Polyangiaceae bacterium]
MRTLWLVGALTLACSSKDLSEYSAGSEDSGAGGSSGQDAATSGGSGAGTSGGAAGASGGMAGTGGGTAGASGGTGGSSGASGGVGGSGGAAGGAGGASGGSGGATGGSGGSGGGCTPVTKSTGWLTAQAASQSAAGPVWQSVDNARVHDNNSSGAALSPSSLKSRVLTVSSFQAGIPETATIQGFEVEIFRHATTSNMVQDGIVQVLIPPAASNNVGKDGFWGTATTNPEYGSASSTLGLTSVTPKDVNSDAFGVQFQALCPSCSEAVTAFVDSIRLRVTYKACP